MADTQLTHLQQSQARAVGSKNPRAYSTDLEDHKALLHKLVQRVHARMMNAKCNAMDYEDLFQTACITYTKARNGYNPEYGITFTAYLGRSVMNDLNKVMEKVMNEHMGLGVIYSEDLATDSEDGTSIYENFASDDESQEERAERLSEARANLRKLDPVTRLYVRMVMQPPKELLDFIASKGAPCLKLALIAEWRKDDKKVLRKVRTAFREVYGVNTSHL